jgi:hypothetical protein
MDDQSRRPIDPKRSAAEAQASGCVLKLGAAGFSVSSALPDAQTTFG